MAEIITDGSQKELKKHGSDEFPLLVSYEKLSGYKSGSFLWHWHPEIEITLVLDGQILYKVNQCTYHMKAGDILLGNANVLHAGFMEDMKDGKYVSITFLPKIIYGSYGSILRRKYVEPFLHNFSIPAVYIDYSQPWHEIFSEYVREIITLYEEKKEFYELDITGTLQKLWRCMLQNLPENLPYTEHSKLERNRMREIMDYLENGNITHSVNYPDCDMGLRGDKTRILVLHHNVPNMIGQISAVLAKDNMNIADLTNKSKGKYAYTMIDVDSEVPEGVVEELKRIGEVLRVRVIC